MKVDGYEEAKGMSEAQNPAFEWIIANTINDTARADPRPRAGLNFQSRSSGRRDGIPFNARGQARISGRRLIIRMQAIAAPDAKI